MMFCINCQDWVYVKTLDFGIGHYEFWGFKGTHHDYRLVCSDCGGSNLYEENEIEECQDCGMTYPKWSITKSEGYRCKSCQYMFEEAEGETEGETQGEAEGEAEGETKHQEIGQR